MELLSVRNKEVGYAEASERYESQIQHLTKSLEDSEHQKNKIETELSQANHTVLNLTAELISLKDQLGDIKHEAEKNINSERNENQKLIQVNEQLEEQWKQIREELSTEKLNISLLQRNNNALSSQMSLMKTDLDEFVNVKQENQKYSERLNQLEEDLKQQQHLEHALKTENADLFRRENELLLRMLEYDEYLNQSKNTIDMMNEEIFGLRLLIDQSKTRYQNDVNSAVGDINTESIDLDPISDDIMDELQVNCDILNERILFINEERLSLLHRLYAKATNITDSATQTDQNEEDVSIADMKGIPSCSSKDAITWTGDDKLVSSHDELENFFESVQQVTASIDDEDGDGDGVGVEMGLQANDDEVLHQSLDIGTMKSLQPYIIPHSANEIPDDSLHDISFDIMTVDDKFTSSMKQELHSDINSASYQNEIEKSKQVWAEEKQELLLSNRQMKAAVAG
jgi:chromosome segregation ATPase